MDQAQSETYPHGGGAAERGSAGWAPTWRLPRKWSRVAHDIELAYVDRAPVDDASSESSTPTLLPTYPASAIVLLHGLTNDADSWADTAEHLTLLAPDARLIIPDLRGHGATGLPADGRWRRDPVGSLAIGESAADVVALLDTLGIESAMVVGHSMGSLVATVCARENPDRVTNLVLVSTTADARTTPFLSDWLRVDVVERMWRSRLTDRGVRWPDEAMAMRPIDIDPDAVAWMEKFWNYYPFTPGRPTTEVAQRAAHLPLATWVGATQAILDTDNRHALTDVGIDVCALWATQDSFFRHADQAELIDLLTTAARQHGSSFVWKQYGHRPLEGDGLQTDDLGHNLTWDAPEQVAVDIAAVWRDGVPTDTWFRSDAPSRPHDIVAVPGAPLVRAP